jgi:hypothetical protein
MGKHWNEAQHRQRVREQGVHERGQQRDQRRLVDVTPVRALTADNEIEFVAEITVTAICPQMQGGGEKREPYGGTGQHCAPSAPPPESPFLIFKYKIAKFEEAVRSVGYVGRWHL